jgi:hypothetical protein
VLDANTIALLNQLGVDAADIESLLWSALLLTGLTIVTAIPTAIIARRKGRSRGLWLLFALSIPVVPLLLIWLLPSVPADRPPLQGNKE